MKNRLSLTIQTMTLLAIVHLIIRSEDIYGQTDAGQFLIGASIILILTGIACIWRKGD